MNQTSWAYHLSKMQESVLANGHIRCRIFDLEEKTASVIHGSYFVPAVMSAYRNMLDSENSVTTFIAVVENSSPYLRPFDRSAANGIYGFENTSVIGADNHLYPTRYMEFRFLIGDPNTLFVFGRNLSGEWDVVKKDWCPRSRFEMTNVNMACNFPNVIEENIPEAMAIPRADQKISDLSFKQLTEITDTLERKYKELLHQNSSYRGTIIGGESDISYVYDDFVNTATGLLNRLLIPIYIHSAEKLKG